MYDNAPDPSEMETICQMWDDLVRQAKTGYSETGYEWRPCDIAAMHRMRAWAYARRIVLEAI